MNLCAWAAIVRDPDKLMLLVHEINDLLEQKERRSEIPFSKCDSTDQIS